MKQIYTISLKLCWDLRDATAITIDNRWHFLLTMVPNKDISIAKSIAEIAKDF